MRNLYNIINLRKSLLFLVINALIVTNLIASSPQGFSYQAVLRDESGEIRQHENVNIGIELIQGGEQGTVVFSENHNSQTNEFGLVNLVIGSQNTPSFQNINWSEAPFFIRISVNNQTMGTTPLMSVPYALYAESGGEPGPQGPQGLQGEPGPQGEQGVGIDFVEDNEDGTFTIYLTNTESFTTPDFTGEQGEAGIGIANVEDNQDGTFTLFFTDETSFTTPDFSGEDGENGADGEDGIGISSVEDNEDGTFTLFFTDQTSFTTPDFRGEAGEPGIGIDSVEDNEDGTFTFFFTDESSFTTPDLTGPQGPAGDGAELWSSDDNDIYFTGGNVGVGTSSPSARLSVNGTFVAGASTNQATGNTSATIGGAGNTASGTSSFIAGGVLNQASGLGAIVLGGVANNAAGDYSFAGGVRAKALHDGSFIWADNTAADFESTDEKQFLIRADGGVGIGTNNPQAMLHIAGGARADNNLFVGGNLSVSGIVTSDLHADGHITVNANGSSNLSYIRFRDSSGTDMPRIYHRNSDNQFHITGIDLLRTFSSFSTSGSISDGTGSIGVRVIEPEHDIQIRQRTFSNSQIPDGAGLAIFRNTMASNEYWNIYQSANNRLGFAYNNLRKRYIRSFDGIAVVIELKSDNPKSAMTPVLPGLQNLNVFQAQSKDNPNQTRIGLEIQSLEQYFPELVDREDPDGPAGISYEMASVIAIKAIQEQSEMIEKQEKTIQNQNSILEGKERRLEQQELLINELMKRVEALENQ